MISTLWVAYSAFRQRFFSSFSAVFQQQEVCMFLPFGSIHDRDGVPAAQRWIHRDQIHRIELRRDGSVWIQVPREFGGLQRVPDALTAEYLTLVPHAAISDAPDPPLTGVEVRSPLQVDPPATATAPPPVLDPPPATATAPPPVIDPPPATATAPPPVLDPPPATATAPPPVIDQPPAVEPAV